MLEKILNIHRQIYYGKESFKDKKTTVSLSRLVDNDLVFCEENSPKVDFASFKITEKPIEDIPKWSTYEEKANGGYLESISDELEFHSRRYGGGLL